MKSSLVRLKSICVKENRFQLKQQGVNVVADKLFYVILQMRVDHLRSNPRDDGFRDIIICMLRCFTLISNGMIGY